MEVYILLHHEITKCSEDGGIDRYRADEMVFFVLSSLKMALKYIKEHGVSEYSWWEIQKQKIDEPEHNWPDHVGHYSRTGKKLKSDPYDKCLAIHKKKFKGGFQ